MIKETEVFYLAIAPPNLMLSANIVAGPAKESFLEARWRDLAGLQVDHSVSGSCPHSMIIFPRLTTTTLTLFWSRRMAALFVSIVQVSIRIWDVDL